MASHSIMNELELTARRLAEAGDKIAEKAAELKAIADRLRADVDALAERVQKLEED